MSQYVETNPHFLPRNRPDFPVPQYIEPEPMQPWEHNPNPHYPDQIPQPDRIQPRPRQQRPHPSPSVRPPRTPPEYAQQLPPSPPRHHRPDPHSNPVSPPRRHHPGPHSYSVEVPQVHPLSRPKPVPHQARPNHTGFEHGPPPPRHENLMYPTPSKTKPLTWFGAVFCCILWLVIILGGLLVLIIYLIYRPRTPHFEISNASLNAAYLDMGSLLNADLTVLANFTNPNKKVNVDFSYITLRLSFGEHLIANQYIEPFSAVNTESKLAYVELISSQVRLPSKVTQQLITQIQRNRIVFEVDGIFHARSNFGSLLRYSYWLYGHCIIEMTGPPTGVVIASKCRTKD